jgi:hypothetical protein
MRAQEAAACNCGGDDLVARKGGEQLVECPTPDDRTTFVFSTVEIS